APERDRERSIGLQWAALNVWVMDRLLIIIIILRLANDLPVVLLYNRTDGFKNGLALLDAVGKLNHEGLEFVHKYSLWRTRTVPWYCQRPNQGPVV
ncbi:MULTISPECIES: hypothetical protein, partial [unclassified Pseudomonas]|uniref:hypothetical protein n=1 Tax=unclassified Pseudomonas TaxID=196821 RepID=UPI001C48F8F9